MNIFLVCAYKSQDFAQNLKNFAQSHDCMTVTFRNSAGSLPFTILQLHEIPCSLALGQVQCNVTVQCLKLLKKTCYNNQNFDIFLITRSFHLACP